LAAAEPPEEHDGVSLVPCLLGENAAGRTQRKHEFLYWEWHPYDWGKGQNVPNGLTQAVRTGNWKAVRPRGGRPLELYDLSKDLGEAHDVAEENPEVVARIEGYMKSARVEPRPQVEPEKAEGRQFR
jgi:arylsulfatase A